MDSFRTQIEQALAADYTFERELGGGGMSRTYLAREHALDRRVVVKVLAPDLLQGLSVERFKREVMLAAQLQHPHVVPVHTAGDANGVPWFIMPYVDGESLRARLDRGPVPLLEAVGMLRDVARALSYAHAHGVVHRDIKPDNVLLSAGSATVTDFGIAKAISASRNVQESATLTQAGIAIGTPAYMAPEQAAGDPDIDHRADIYAFGAMAYELLTGQPVFTATTAARLLVAQIHDTPQDIRELAPALPAPLSDVVMRCLAKEPSARPADAAEIMRTLDMVVVTGGEMPAAAPFGVRVSLGGALARWAAVAAVVLLVTWAATVTVGLPSWAFSAAVAVTLAGLPAVLGTWWVQRTARHAVMLTPRRTAGGTLAPAGTMVTMALQAAPHVTWRRTWRVGAIAVGALALSVVGFVGTRAMGIGPAASLRGAGEFSERETIVVADFTPPAGDSLLGVTVAEALRTDLAQSPNLRVLSKATVREVLTRMQRDAQSTIAFTLAREVATREGAKAVLDGDLVELGGQYVLSARLVAALDGRELATFRATADDQSSLMSAVGELSRAIREKVGESLSGLRNAQSMERVTTSSLEALRKYVAAVEAGDVASDLEQSLALLNEAIALDSGFAMAWRKKAVTLNNMGLLRTPAQLEAATRAWTLRDRLSDEERGYTDAWYYTYGPEPDLTKALAAYERLIAFDTSNVRALNNAVALHMRRRDFTAAAEIGRRMASLPELTPSAIGTSLVALLLVNDTVAATQLLAKHASTTARYPQEWYLRASLLSQRGQLDSAMMLARSNFDGKTDGATIVRSAGTLATITTLTGRTNEGMRYTLAYEQAATDSPDDPRPGLWSGMDSAFHAVFFNGNTAQSRVMLKRLTSPERMSGVDAIDRPWTDFAVVAALAGDAAVARAAAEGYERDVASSDLERQWQSRRLAALTAFAEGDWDKVNSEFAAGRAHRVLPDAEEMFLRALAHERAGRADSALVWFEMAATTPLEIDLSYERFHPAAIKRYAELLDARGDARGALAQYERFAELWKNAEPQHQPAVRAVRSRAAELRARIAPG